MKPSTVSTSLRGMMRNSALRWKQAKRTHQENLAEMHLNSARIFRRLAITMETTRWRG